MLKKIDKFLFGKYSNEDGFWDILAAIGSIGRSLVDWAQYEFVTKPGQIKLAKETEAEEERLQAKKRAIEEKEWGYRKEDILKEGEETRGGFVESQTAKNVLWSSMTEEGKSKIASRVSTVISRAEKLRAEGYDLEADIMKTQFKLGVTRPEELGLFGSPGYDITRSALGITGAVGQYGQRAQQLAQIEGLMKGWRSENVGKKYTTPSIDYTTSKGINIPKLRF